MGLSLEGRLSFIRTLTGWRQSSRDLRRFNTGECRILALVWEDILLPSRLGINLLKSNFVKNDLRTPVNNRGNRASSEPLL